MPSERCCSLLSLVFFFFSFFFVQERDRSLLGYCCLSRIPSLRRNAWLQRWTPWPSYRLLIGSNFSCDLPPYKKKEGCFSEILERPLKRSGVPRSCFVIVAWIIMYFQLNTQALKKTPKAFIPSFFIWESLSPGIYTTIFVGPPPYPARFSVHHATLVVTTSHVTPLDSTGNHGCRYSKIFDASRVFISGCG